MGLIGAILGDIAGSNWEFGRPDDLDYKTVELFTDKNTYTDDTVLSIATKWAINNDIPFANAYSLFANQYPNAGYGASFYDWFHMDELKPYNSFGNGSAMRVSYIADKFDNISDITHWAIKSAECTHNHEEGLKGATVTATCSYFAKDGLSKDAIYNYMLQMYPTDKYEWSGKSLDEIRPNYRFDETCQGSIPVAIRCFYESDSYESFLRNVFSLRCDADTLGAIGGCIAENYYGKTGFDNEKLLKKYLDDDLYEILMGCPKLG